ncbi:glycoside hydrolase family 15 protein [Dactylosporangium sp. CA-139066]|uniref:glycoside hydrolase family 15 protein n=1 Tax=Dactylosporangium sp. CA-139066 TaxID=3239930 RepID=UPI003D8B201F
MRASSFPSIESYGFLSDCETTALVAPSGNVEWLCLPRLDSPSVFGAILDRDAGGFRVGPADTMVPAARRYLPGTMVLETSWGTPTGWLIVCDVLLMGPWHHDTERSRTHRRAPTDYDAEHVLLRTIRCVSGEVQLNLDCEPIFCYGRQPGRWEYPGPDYHEGLCHADGSDIQLRLTTDLRIGFEATRAVGRTLMKDGDRRFCALSWTSREPPRDWDNAQGRLIWTAHHWQRWLARGDFPDHPFRAHLERSALTLKGLSYAPTGALAAAATTSLPETPSGERNFDYRYSWIRDSSFTLWALNTLGLTWEADDYRRFITEIASRYIDLQVMYGVGGEHDLTEHPLDHLHGYEGARPVRVGNDAFQHHQHDVWGTMVDSVYLYTKARDWLDDRLWQVLVHQVESAAKHWREPDRGIWEVRGEPRHFTSSKVMCWVALDRGARLARLREEWGRAEQWQQYADDVHADVLANGVDEHGVFKQDYDTGMLDASLLLVPLVRFLPPDDPRVRATVLAIAAELTVDDLVLRYRTETTDDGFTGEEGTFAVCSFWLVSALVEIGEVERGRRLCGKLLSFAGPLGLYAEQIQPDSGRHLGNFPQALTHLALINAVFHVIRNDEAYP